MKFITIKQIKYKTEMKINRSVGLSARKFFGNQNKLKSLFRNSNTLHCMQFIKFAI